MANGKNRGWQNRPDRGGPVRPGPAADTLYIYGLHPVRAALANPRRRCRQLLATAEGLERLRRLADAELKARAGECAVTVVDRARIDHILPRGAVHQGLALEAGGLDEPALDELLDRIGGEAPAIVVALDQVTDPHNVGAILRSAAVFGAAAVIATERHAPGETALLAKSAAGALDLVPLIRVTNLVRSLIELQEAGFWCLGLDGAADKTIDAATDSPRLVLVLGAEGEGLRRLTRETCDIMARIPMAGAAGGVLDSLNVSNAAAVALYALSRRTR